MKELQNKDIILFGAGDRAKDFYKKYHSKLRIIGCVSNNPNEKHIAMYDGTVFSVKRPTPQSSNYSVYIICSQFYNEISRQLYCLGYTPYKDFYIYSEVESIGDKQTICFYGKCFIQALSFIFFDKLDKNKYNVILKSTVPDLYVANEEFGEVERFQFYMKRCQVFVYGIEADKKVNEELKWWMQLLPDSCKKIGIPHCAFWSYFPSNTIGDFKYNELGFKQAPYNAFPFYFGDDLINQMIKDGCGEEQILNKVMDEDLYSKEFLSERLDKNLKVIQLMFRNTDINIYSWIKSNYKKTQIFRDMWHSENEMVNQIAVQIIDIIDDILQDKSDIDIKSDCPYPLLLSNKHIIYPCVVKHLELEWDFNSAQYEINTSEGMKKVGFNEYIREYIHMSTLTMELQNKNYLFCINSVRG